VFCSDAPLGLYAGYLNGQLVVTFDLLSGVRAHKTWFDHSIFAQDPLGQDHE